MTGKQAKPYSAQSHPATQAFPAGDLDACSREPIHIPGSIQPQGVLLVLDADRLTVVQAAIGDAAPAAFADPLGRPIAALLPGQDDLLRQLGAAIPEAPTHIGTVRIGDGRHHAIAHRRGGRILLELESAAPGDPGSFEDVYPFVRGFLAELQAAASIEALNALAAREVRRITGLDRVLVYRFDADGNGTVVAESGGGRLPSYLGLRFPAADIPAQARELYRLNRLRLIADADYVPVPIVPPCDPDSGAPVDLSLAVLRSVSPVHLEYMRNMGTGASMSISLVGEDRLWGLISCHHRDAHRVPFHVRAACEMIGQILALQIIAKEQAALAERRIALRQVQLRLLARMAAEENFVDGLVADPADLLGLVQAGGAAIVAGSSCRLIGETPPEDAVLGIAEWLALRAEDVFVSDCLSQQLSQGERIKDEASGLLAISISKLHASYVMWFRPEVVRTVGWGGAPGKAAGAPGSGGDGDAPEGARIHPRKSFEVWKEIVQRRSAPWDEAEVDAATNLRTAIVDIVLRTAEELAELNEALLRSNKELEAFSYSVSHDLRAPFRHIVGYSQLLKQMEGGSLSERGNRYIDTIIESALSAGTLVDDLLSFSQMGRSTLRPIRIDMNQLVEEVRRKVALDHRDHAIEWRIGRLAPVAADPTMLRLLLQNLLENAAKFSRERTPAVIEVGSAPRDGETLFWVRDNGVGFDMAYVGKLFGVFQRLHRIEEFEGTGIGLANVKRIVERHGGRTWAEGRLDHGATIFFTLPFLPGAPS